MDYHIFWQIIFQLVLIFLNAVFACAEIAVLSVSDTKLEYLADGGNKKAAKLLKMTKTPAKFLATIQVAITLSGFIGSAFAADNFAHLITDAVEKTGFDLISAEAVNNISVVIITLLLSYLTLVFGELVPKRLAMKNSEKLALGMASLVSFLAKLFAPIVWLLTVSTNLVLRMCGIDPNAEEEDVTEEEIRMMVDAGSETGAIDEEEKELIQNVFEFDDISADEIATHRTEIDLLWMEDSPAEWDETIRSTRHSMYPICGESVDDVIGILNVPDYFRMDDTSDRDKVMAESVRQPYFVSENAHADVIFRQMQKTKTHFAVVLDEYGGTVGILTISDLLEQIVGDLDDEGDEVEPEEIRHLHDNVWEIRGTAPLDEVLEATGAVYENEEDYDTFGGLVFGSLAAIPEDGETFDLEVPPFSVSVREIVDHKVSLAVVTVALPEKDEDETEEKE